MSSGYERPDSGDGGTACAYTDHEAADDIDHGEGSSARGEGVA